MKTLVQMDEYDYRLVISYLEEGAKDSDFSKAACEKALKILRSEEEGE